MLWLLKIKFPKQKNWNLQKDTLATPMTSKDVKVFKWQKGRVWEVKTEMYLLFSHWQTFCLTFFYNMSVCMFQRHTKLLLENWVWKYKGMFGFRKYF